MKLFSFDNYWGLDWLKSKTNSNSYSCKMRDFAFTVDTSKAHMPKFCIYHKEINEANCLVMMIDADVFIHQLKSIKEYGKVIKR